MLSRFITSLRNNFRPANDPPKWAREIFGYSVTASGVDVSADNALTSTAVYACVNILAQSIASLPLKIYRRNAEGTYPAPEHPLYRLLHDEPNPEMSAYSFWYGLMVALTLRGNAIAEIEMDSAGRIVALWPLRADKYKLTRDPATKELVYVYTLPGGERIGLPSYRVFHVKNHTLNGIDGVSPIAYHRETIGLALAAEQFGATFFGNGGTVGGIIKHPKELTDTAYKHLKESWEARHQGLENAHRLAILEDGMTYEKIGIAQDDAQYLETRVFQKREIASIFRVPPYKIGDMEQATFSNIEHQSLEFVRDSLQPYIINIEQESKRKLLLAREKGKYYPRFVLDGILRGDIASRYNALSVAWDRGIINADEWRAMEDWNPLPDGQGKAYYVPLNYAAAGQPDEQKDAKTAPKTDQKRAKNVQNALETLFTEQFQRIFAREAKDLRDLRKKPEFDAKAYYNGKHAEFVEGVTAPLVRAAATLAATALDAAAADDFCAEYARTLTANLIHTGIYERAAQCDMNPEHHARFWAQHYAADLVAEFTQGETP